MSKISEISFSQIREKLRLKKPWDNILLFLLNLLISVPLFIILHQNLIDLDWYFKLDRILIFVVLLVIIQLVLRLLRTLLLVLLALYLGALTYGSLTNEYGFNSVYEDYRYIIYAMSDSPHPQDLILSRLLPFPNKSRILKAVQYDNSQVRNFSVMATRKHFSEVRGYSDYRVIIQSFAVFKEINSNWNYVSDPKGREYIATASESLRHLSGDCDDHSILMAACVKAIGGTPRLIHTGGHIYPEILIGTKADLEKINYLVKQVLFVKEAENQTLHYHIDERGQVWLNLDYTAKYPGGPFMRDEILGALTLN